MLDPNEWMSTGQAARRLDISTQWIWRQAKEGHLDHVKMPGGLLFRREAVENLAKQRADRQTVSA